MKKIAYILIFLMFCGIKLNAQVLDSKGTINNTGTIKVRGMLTSDQGGKIQNEGRLIIEAQSKIDQDTLNGKVEFALKDNVAWQIVPQLVYKNVEFSGIARKKFDTTGGKTFVALDSFKTHPEVEILTDKDNNIITKGKIVQDGYINISNRYGKLIMQGDTSQTITGKGEFKQLELDNQQGADVVEGGGFHVLTSLELVKGELRNSTENNFTMVDSTDIIRHAGASLRTEPLFAGNVTVRYTGTGEMATTGEIPSNTATLKSWYVENSGTVTLTKNATVNDSLVLNSNIETSVDTLTLVGTNNPIFDPANKNIEIMGTFARRAFNPGDTILLNNAFTWAYFQDQNSMNGLNVLFSYVRPSTFPLQTGGDNKIKRLMNLQALDAEGTDVSKGVNMSLGYGFKYNPGDPGDESNGLTLADLALQRWLSTEWINLDTPKPKLDFGWGYSFSDNVTDLGSFAMGIFSNTIVYLQVKALLEGPYIKGSGDRMTTYLSSLGILTKSPQNYYPVSLDKNFNEVNFASMPDSVVDWAVLEFRKSRNEPGIFKTFYLKNDGEVVDQHGNQNISVSLKDGLDTNGGSYYVVFRQRNHSPVVTQDPVPLYTSEKNIQVDFTDPSVVEGGTTALKFVDLLPNGKSIFAIRSGYLIDTQDAISKMLGVPGTYTEERDYKSAWENFTNEGYLYTDYDLNGIVTTMDFNYSWNNRLIK